jgi:hypothetical protein
MSRINLGVTHCPLLTTIGLGSACQGTPLIRPCRLDDGIHAVDTPDKHHPDPDYALNGLHPINLAMRHYTSTLISFMYLR